MTKREAEFILGLLPSNEKKRIIRALQQEVHFSVPGFDRHPENANNSKIADSLIRKSKLIAAFMKNLLEMHERVLPGLDGIETYDIEAILSHLNRDNSAFFAACILEKEGCISEDLQQKMNEILSDPSRQTIQPIKQCDEAHCQLVSRNLDSISRLKKELLDSQEEKKGIKRDRDDYKKQVRQLEVNIQALENEKNRDIETLNAELQTANTRAQELQLKTEKLLKDLSSKTEEIKLLVEEKHTIQTRLELLQQEHSRILDELEVLKKKNDRKIVIFSHREIQLPSQINATVRFIDPDVPYTEVDCSLCEEIIAVRSELDMLNRKRLADKYKNHITWFAAPAKMIDHLLSKEDTY